MPNLKPPVTTTARAVEYREEILKALPPGSSFEPLMTLYLTDNTSPEEIKLASTCALHAIICYSTFLNLWSLGAAITRAYLSGPKHIGASVIPFHLSTCDYK
jgi:hypothetical protein